MRTGRGPLPLASLGGPCRPWLRGTRAAPGSSCRAPRPQPRPAGPVGAQARSGGPRRCPGRAAGTRGQRSPRAGDAPRAERRERGRPPGGRPKQTPPRSIPAAQRQVERISGLPRGCGVGERALPAASSPAEELQAGKQVSRQREPVQAEPRAPWKSALLRRSASRALHRRLLTRHLGGSLETSSEGRGAALSRRLQGAGAPAGGGSLQDLFGVWGGAFLLTLPCSFFVKKKKKKIKVSTSPRRNLD